jgi:hypothetical protein
MESEDGRLFGETFESVVPDPGEVVGFLADPKGEARSFEQEADVEVLVGGLVLPRGDGMDVHVKDAVAKRGETGHSAFF